MSSSQSRETTTTTYSKLTSITRGSDFTEHINFNTALVEVDVFESTCLVQVQEFVLWQSKVKISRHNL